MPAFAVFLPRRGWSYGCEWLRSVWGSGSKHGYTEFGKRRENLGANVRASISADLGFECGQLTRFQAQRRLPILLSGQAADRIGEAGGDRLMAVIGQGVKFAFDVGGKPDLYRAQSSPALVSAPGFCPCCGCVSHPISPARWMRRCHDCTKYTTYALSM